jgi:hypothetical protein
MRLSSGFRVVEAVGLAGAQDRVQDVDAAAGERDQRLVMALPFGAFTGVEGALAVG